jgi:hypothetical protein
LVGSKKNEDDDQKSGVGLFFVVVSDFSLDKLKLCGIITLRLILKG